MNSTAASSFEQASGIAATIADLSPPIPRVFDRAIRSPCYRNHMPGVRLCQVSSYIGRAWDHKRRSSLNLRPLYAEASLANSFASWRNTHALGKLTGADLSLPKTSTTLSRIEIADNLTGSSA